MFIAIIKDFHTNMYAVVVSVGIVSGGFKVHVGVNQGHVLDLPSFVHHCSSEELNSQLFGSSDLIQPGFTGPCLQDFGWKRIKLS